VRLKLLNTFAGIVALVAVSVALPVQRARAQNPDNMMPEEREAKGKRVLDQLITALGGPTYLDIRESDCDGRLAQFGHNGELTGYTNFKVYWRYPDKNRTDFSKKGVVVNIYNGDQGWTLDRGGVTELSATAVADFQEQAKRDINNLLRVRLKEPGMAIRYGGRDVVDLRTVDWVEITDSEQRDFRLAVDQTTHYLVRSVVTLADDTSPDRSVETHIYTNYQLMDGVWTPLQITLDRNGRRINQVFFQSCKYNPGFPENFFTKAALDKRFSEVGSKKYKEEKKKEKEKEREAAKDN
jgi:outer membrane lipoprotein-sorting protein